MGFAEFLGGSEGQAPAAPKKKVSGGGFASFMAPAADDDDEQEDDTAPGGFGSFLAPAASRPQGRIKAPKAGKETPEQLEAYEAELEALQQATGAPKIEEEKPGFLARTLDVLSGFNYAVAGAYEELAQGKSPGDAVSRAGAELYSSARSLPFGQLLPQMDGAQKEGFGQVMEQLGVGTTTLADVAPALEGTFLGNLINTRGTAGLALDILLDPTTYLTFGTSAVAKSTVGRFAKLGLKKGLTKQGLREFGAIEKGLREAAGVFGKSVTKEVDDEIMTQAAKQLMDRGDMSLFDHGGAKLAGIAIPGTQGLGHEIFSVLSKPLVNTLNARGHGARIVKNAKDSWESAKALVAETFGFGGPLEHLPSGQRDEALKGARKWIESRALLNARYIERASDSLEYFRAHPERQQAVMDMLDDGKIQWLNPEEQKAGEALQSLFDEIAKDGVREGIFQPAQVARPSYMFHRYLNRDPEDISEAWLGHRGIDPNVTSRHAMERDFSTMREAERISRMQENVSRAARSLGIATPLKKVLKPDYDLESGLLKYIDWYSGKKAQHGLAKEMLGRFGVEDTPYRQVVDKLFENGQDIIDSTHPQYQKVQDFFDRPTIAGMRRTAGEGLDLAAVGKRPRDIKRASWQEIVTDAGKILPTLDGGGKRQFFHEMFKRVNSEGQLIDIMKDFNEYKDFWPKSRAPLDGTAEDALLSFGDLARYRQVGGNALWGEGTMHIPDLIARYVEGADRRLLNTKDFKGFREAVKWWDKTNNMFKFWVYPLFIASHVRNAYSNVALSGLRIGWHAVDPSLHRHTVGILGKAGNVIERETPSFLSRFGRRYSYDEVRDLIKAHNVEAGPGQLLELTGEGATRVKKTGLKGRLAHGQARIENQSRVSLFVQDLIDGLTPEEASADVSKFLFNYNELGPIHREIVRRFVPFSVFTTKNIKLQVEMLRTNPGLVANQLKPFRGRDSENREMVKFEAEALKLRLNQDGKTVQTLTGIDLPLRNMDNIWAGGVGATGRRLIGMLTPILKVPIELAAGKDMFTGRDFGRVEGQTLGRAAEHLPKAVQDWIGYRKENDDAGRPRYTFDGLKYHLLVRSYIFSRIMSTSDRQFREYLKDGNVASSMIDLVTGLRVKDLNLDEQNERKLRTRIRQLEQSLVRRGELRTFERRYQPKQKPVQQ